MWSYILYLPVITQGREVMFVLGAIRDAAYVPRSSTGRTCSTLENY